MKLLKSLFLATGLLTVFCVNAQEKPQPKPLVTFKDATGFVYNILSEPENGAPGTCEIGSNLDYFGTTVTVPETVEYDGQTYNVIGIAYRAFSLDSYDYYINYNQLISKIDASGNKNLQYIGAYAFPHCNLTSVDFSGCTALDSIGNSAFEDCRIKTVNFSGCTSLRNTGSNSFYESSIYEVDFSGCTSLTSISPYTFDDVYALSTANFSGCTNLTIIDEGAFTYCGDLTTADFSGCVNLKTIGNSAFYNCRNLLSIVLGDSPNIETISRSAFYNCYVLQNFDFSTFPKLTSIESYAFQNCRFESVDLSKCTQLTSIGYQAFYWCSTLGYIHLPSSLEYVGGSCFNTPSLFLVVCDAITPPEYPTDLWKSLFNEYTRNNGTLMVPKESLTEYGRNNADGYGWGEIQRQLPIGAVSWVTVDPEKVYVGLGETTKITAKCLPAVANPIANWQIDADYVMKIEPVPGDPLSVNITAIGEGECFVTVTVCAEGFEDYTASAYTASYGVDKTLATAIKVNMGSGMTMTPASPAFDLRATVEPENAFIKDLLLTTDTDEFLQIKREANPDFCQWTMTPIKAGVTKLTFATTDGSELTDEYKVIVTEVLSVDVEPGDGTNLGDPNANDVTNTQEGASLIGNDITMRVGQTASLNLNAGTRFFYGPQVVWTLKGDKSSVKMTVDSDSNGMKAEFQGLTEGELTYSVSFKGDDNVLASGTITVIESNPLVTLEINPSAVTLALNALPIQLEAVGSPADAYVPELSWTSSDDSVATVDTDGTVTPVAKGSCVITVATTEGPEISATCTVTITDEEPVGFEFDFDESVMGGVEGITLSKGETYQFAVKPVEGYQLPENITWTSANPDVATVDNDGVVTAVATGTTEVTASAVVGTETVTATCTVTVLPVEATMVVISEQQVIMDEGDTVQLTADVYPDDTFDKTVKWSSSNPNVAVVDQTGLVTAVGAGNATITASCGNAHAFCDITAIANPAGLEDIMADPNNVVDVYTIGGSLVRRGVNAGSLNTLQQGVYVIVSNGKSYKVRL